MEFFVEDMILAKEDAFMDTLSTFGIRGMCVSGARIYSPEFETEADARAAIEDYESFVDYFGGGTVEIYEIHLDDFACVYRKFI